MLAALAWLSPLRDIEPRWGLSALYAIRGVRPAPPQVSVIAMNLRAAEKLGVPARPDRWPRSLHAELVDGLHEVGATVVAFDLLFDRAREPDGDQRLMQAMRRSGNVVLVQYLRRDKLHAGNSWAVVDRVVEPLPLFAEAALASAPFIVLKARDGISEYPAFVPEGGALPSLPLLLAAIMEPAPLAALASAVQIGGAQGTEGAQGTHALPSQLVALRRLAQADTPRRAALLNKLAASSTPGWPSLLSVRNPRVTFNFYGPPGRIDTIGYDRAIEWLRSAAPEAARLRGRAVLVGLSEFNQPEQRDVYPTPWSSVEGLDISGAELAATALANQLDGSALRRLPATQELGVTAVLSALFLVPWLFWLPWHAALASVAIASVYSVGAALLFERVYLWLPLALPLLVVLPCAVVVGLVLRYSAVERQRVRLRTALTHYAPDEVIGQLARELQGRDDLVNVVCLSSDIEDYTHRVECRNPADARAWINAYFENVFPIIRAHGGHVVDHAGDSMVCVWLSRDQPAAACLAAVQAGLAIHTLCNTCQGEQLSATDLDAWPTRIGLHLGPVSLGETNVGDMLHAQPRIVGDIVNTASRIQSANKALGCRVLVSEPVAAHLPTHSVRPLGRFMLQGKAQPVGLVDPMPATPELSALYAQALTAREQGLLDAARSALDRLRAKYPNDGPTAYLLTQLNASGPLSLSLK
ncbi:MAG: CHASE2 domain-containing protein [Burkholderiaceae bacterium]|nr:CHASE2 domain-containing protein [Burkholderiaceae bacterium]MDH3459873.1 CHASE2 domain-containing protein [Burkholderiaceae bacterium]